MNQPCTIDYLFYDTLRAIIFTNEGKVVDDLLLVGLLRSIEEERRLNHEVEHLGQVLNRAYRLFQLDNALAAV